MDHTWSSHVPILPYSLEGAKDPEDLIVQIWIWPDFKLGILEQDLLSYLSSMESQPVNGNYWTLLLE